ncbi:MAG TPA: CRTAC1 family protein, partial [Planctomycetota bacterium]|nr:CRTAC1 family protein [Planctomycetota bacterium]
YDGDGRLDLLFVNQRRWPGHEADYPSPASRPATPRLYRNAGDGRFEDATEAAGLAVEMCGMGAAAADVDGDGDQDLVVTALGDTKLFRNDGGKFVECAREAGLVTPRWKDKDGVEHPMWGTSAAFLDYDRDGVLDLFVAAYVKWSEATDIYATLDGSTKAFTTPDLYPGDASRLYRGLGGGRFEDVTERAGVFNPNGKSLGVAVCDVDDDGWPDLAVANDTQPNFLYRNDRGRFRDIGPAAAVAYDSNGRARAGMGIDAVRLVPGGGTALAIGNFSLEPVSLFVEKGNLVFADDAGVAGLANPTWLSLTFGLAFVDVDLDGRLDLAIANGHIEPTVQSVQREVSYAQRPQLFWNRGDGRFHDLSASAGEAFQHPLVGRGLAAGDLDGDGDPDLAITQNGGPAVVLRCDRGGAAKEHRFLRVKPVGKDGNLDALGAVVRATYGGRTEERVVRTGSSYLSQSETVATFGLGASTFVERLEVRWPWGALTRLERVPASAEPLVVKP